MKSTRRALKLYHAPRRALVEKLQCKTADLSTCLQLETGVGVGPAVGHFCPNHPREKNTHHTGYRLSPHTRGLQDRRGFTFVLGASKVGGWKAASETIFYTYHDKVRLRGHFKAPRWYKCSYNGITIVETIAYVNCTVRNHTRSDWFDNLQCPICKRIILQKSLIHFNESVEHSIRIESVRAVTVSLNREPI